MSLSHPLDFKMLRARLQETTPPPEDPDDSYENEACRYLTSEECPLCDQDSCVPYWRTSDGGSVSPSCAQAASWRAFRRFQLAMRNEKRLGLLERNVRARRRAYDLQHVSVHLQSKPDKQSRVQNWIEYQDFLLSDDARFQGDLGDKSKSQHVRDIVKQSYAIVRRQCFIQHVLPWTENVRTANTVIIRTNATTSSRRNCQSKRLQKSSHPGLTTTAKKHKKKSGKGAVIKTSAN
jgi:hypothetical protein